MQLQFRNTESSLHWQICSLFPSVLHLSEATYWSALELSSHSTICALSALLCACLHPENTCRAPHQQRKRPEATRWVHFPFIFITAAAPHCVPAFRNLISAALSWQEQSKIWRAMETQLWGVTISFYWWWNVCRNSMITYRRYFSATSTAWSSTTAKSKQIKKSKQSYTIFIPITETTLSIYDIRKHKQSWCVINYFFLLFILKAFLVIYIENNYI